MGYWTQWFVAERRDAKIIAKLKETGSFPSVYLDSVIQSDLDSLGDLLGAPYTDYIPVIRWPIFGRQLIIEISDEFISKVVSIHDDEIPGLGSKWSDEVELLSEEETTKLLRDIVKICRIAKARGKTILELPA